MSATPDDFFALGLHPDAIVSALAMVSRVAHVGGGSGVVSVAEGASPLGVYDVRIQVVAPGNPGVATVRWTLDAGLTWSATVTAPNGSPLVLDVTGLAVTFDGALVAGDLYSFTAVRALERHLDAANAKTRAILRRRFKGAIPAWDASVVEASVAQASLSILTQRGFNPKDGADAAISDRADTALKYLKDVGASIAHPDGMLDVVDTDPVAVSDLRRED